MRQVFNMADINGIAEAIKDMQEDSTVPKNVKTKLTEVEAMLVSEKDNSMNVNKALDILVEISDDINLQPYVRTKIWNVVSMLEAL